MRGAARVSPALRTENLMKAHMLLVDDDRHITEILRRALAYEGYTVDVAHRGDEALQKAIERPPDLVVLALMLPGMDGLEVCRRLRASGNQGPILMLTAKDSIPDRVAGAAPRSASDVPPAAVPPARRPPPCPPPPPRRPRPTPDSAP